MENPSFLSHLRVNIIYDVSRALMVHGSVRLRYADGLLAEIEDQIPEASVL